MPQPSIDLPRARRHRLEILRSVVSESVAAYLKYVWPVIDPTRALLPSVALDGMCAAGQAVAEGRIKRLAVSTCPGTSKSIFWGIAYPSWLFLRYGGRPRIMVGSYSWDFATRDSRRCRDLVVSPQYEELTANAWDLRPDANRDDDWWTTSGGRRMIVSVGGKALGERCTFQLIDDALSGADIHSKTAKTEATRWVNEVLPSRMEDPDNDPRIMIGQRLAVDDPIAEAVRQGWKYLYLPAVLGEDEEPCTLYDDAGELVWKDERKPGEPIVSLLGPEALARLRLELGSTAFTAQYLQKPADDSASIIRRTWWRFYRTGGRILPKSGAWVADGEGRDDLPRPAGCDEETPTIDKPDHFDRTTMAVDLTFGSITGDYADIKVWSALGPDRFLVGHWRKRTGFEESLAAIEELDGVFPGCKKLIEKAANGAATIEMARKRIPGIIAQMPIGKKPQRLSAIAPTVEAGNAYLPLGASWLPDFIEELAGATKHDDQCDTTSYAIIDLNVAPVDTPSVGGFLIGG